MSLVHALALVISQVRVMARSGDGKTGKEAAARESATRPTSSFASAKNAKKLLRQGQRNFARARHGAAATSARIVAMAGSASAKSAKAVGSGGQKSWLAFGTLWTQKLLPRMQKAGQWLRRRLRPSLLLHDYRRILLLIHKLGPDRSIERLCFVTTSKTTPLSLLRVPHLLRRTGHDYRPTPRLVFKWAMEALPEDLARHAFVDYGAGRGRVLLMASHYPFERIIGAEIAAELYDDCLLNIAQYPRSLMKCRDAGCDHLAAMRLEVPDQETAFYFNNPFNRKMLERVVGRIVQSYKRNPRRFYVICVDINARALFEDTGIFHEVAIPWRQRLKLAAFSPYSIAIYQSVV